MDEETSRLCYPNSPHQLSTAVPRKDCVPPCPLQFGWEKIWQPSWGTAAVLAAARKSEPSRQVLSSGKAH